MKWYNKVTGDEPVYQLTNRLDCAMAESSSPFLLRPCARQGRRMRYTDVGKLSYKRSKVTDKALNSCKVQILARTAQPVTPLIGTYIESHLHKLHVLMACFLFIYSL